VLVVVKNYPKARGKLSEGKLLSPVVVAVFSFIITNLTLTVGLCLMKFKKGLPIVFSIFLVVLISIFFYFSLQPFSASPNKKVFVINQGDSLSTIGLRLEKNNFIKNRYVFIIYTYILGLNQKIQAGTFYLNPASRLPDLIRNLSTGGSTDYWLKIIPGSRLEQFSPSPEFTAVATKFEGQLFPDSYLIPQDYSPTNILDIIFKNFNKKISKAQENKTTVLTDSETLIVASLLEREAKTLADKKLIAGIIISRLNIDMPLQIDATIQYAKDTQIRPDSYWRPISKADLSINSPYNTYKNRGLPPAPICNPGLDSLIAAYHPTDSDYFYYLNDKSGQIHYAKTYVDHNANVAKYLR